MELRRLTTLDEMLPHLALLQQLTASLVAAEYRSWLVAMIPHNYAMVAAFEGEQCLGLSGYWIAHKFYCGKYMEIDNFVVDRTVRSQGIGRALVDWLEHEARTQDCRTLMLDAYVENFEAHRFYYRRGFHARGFHYLKQL